MVKDVVGNPVFNLFLDYPTKRPSPHLRIVTQVDQLFVHVIRNGNVEVLFLEHSVNVIDHQVDDLHQVLLGEGVELDDVIKPV